MATGSWPTLLDLTSRVAADGSQPLIAEMLSQCNDIWDDMPIKEANEMGGHEFVFRTSIPGGYWRTLNQGVPYSKSTTAKGRVGMGVLEDYSQVDRLLAETSGDIQEFRKNEAVGFLEGMSQTMAQTVFYGNTASVPQQFMGLAPFYNTVNTSTALNAANVIDGGGTGSSNLSIWLVCWSPRSVYATFPRGSKAGLVMEDKGDDVPGFDSVGNRFEAYTFWFRQQMAIVPEDWRYAVRLCNVDVTTAGLAGPSALDLFATMAQMVLLPPKLSKGTSGITQTDAPSEAGLGVRPVFYTNRTGRHWMDIQAMRDRNVLLSINDYAGKPTMNFRGEAPIRIVDQLTNTEARIT